MQFIPTTITNQSKESISSLVSKIQLLLKTEDWTQFASTQFVEIANELRRMDRKTLQEFKTKYELK